jgi:multidrug efflux pump subunit AcrA (membrane-fusion protein)/beta-lactamase regulating signal transducer with metallopeptidase domain
MTAIQFLAEWALRSSLLILGGGLLLWALRVKDPSIRLAAWTAMLLGSLAIPALTPTLPRLSFPAMAAAARSVATPSIPYDASSAPVTVAPGTYNVVARKPFDWSRAALTLYALVALTLLLRLCVGILMSRRLLRASRAAGQTTEGIEIRESDRIAAPVTLGIWRPAILLPGDWRDWNAAKRDAVLAHERSHIRRRDPAVQVLSALHRALLWHSPLSWFLHKRLVRVAEEASDDAALAVTRDRPFYAEVLLEFMQRGGRRAGWVGVPMARYGRPDKRIHRILEGTAVSRGVTRWSLAGVLVFGTPLAYLAAAANPQAPQPPQVKATAAPAPAPAPQMAAHTPYLAGLGSVSAFYTVVVKPRVSGELMSMDFKEGDSVQQGQLLATIDPRPYQLLVEQAEGQVEQDQAQFASSGLAELKGRIATDQAKVDSARLQLAYTKIVAPISGILGLRMVDPGNMVQAESLLVVITQLQPIAVMFTVPEDNVREVRAHLSAGANPSVEAWNRDNSSRIAVGHLTAIDNQIDETTGTIKLKAVFDNKDGALFPNQFVNVHLFLNAQ